VAAISSSIASYDETVKGSTVEEQSLITIN
jgi:hypothetical protein